MSAPSYHVAILGSGVIGLSTALAILEDQQEISRGSKTLVTIVSKEVPHLDDKNSESNRKHSAEYASVWAVSSAQINADTT